MAREDGRSSPTRTSFPAARTSRSQEPTPSVAGRRCDASSSVSPGTFRLRRRKRELLLDPRLVELLQAASERPAPAEADRAPIDGRDGEHPAHGARDEGLVGAGELVRKEVALLDRDRRGARLFDDDGPRHAIEDAFGARSAETTATDEKDVRGRPFGDETLLSKEDRLLRSGEPSLAKRKHVVEEVAALDRRIERVGADAAKRRDDDRDSPIRTAR